MAEILIHGMKMPESCSDCPMCYDMIECTVSPLRFWHGRPENEQFDFCNERHPVCPLIELPPHGDLIDVSKVVLEYGGLAKISPYDFVGIAKYFAEQLEEQPVVVPAERREGDGD